MTELSDNKSKKMFPGYLPIVRFRLDCKAKNLLHRLATNIVTVLTTDQYINNLGYTKQDISNALLYYYNCWSCGCLNGSDPSAWECILKCLSLDTNTAYYMLNELVDHLDRAHDFLIECKPTSMRSNQIIDMMNVPCLDEMGLYKQLKRQCPSIVFLHESDTLNDLPDLKLSIKESDYLEQNLVCGVHKRLANLCDERDLQNIIAKMGTIISSMSNKKTQQNLLCLFGVANVHPLDKLKSIRTPSNLLLLLNACVNSFHERPKWDNLVFLEEDVRSKLTAEYKNANKAMKSLERLLFFFNRFWKQIPIIKLEEQITENDQKKNTRASAVKEYTIRPRKRAYKKGEVNRKKKRQTTLKLVKKQRVF